MVEVWFDSGATHAFVLEARDGLKWPADLYLEGTDQHRGWFQSSLLVACGTRGRPPYDGVLTHGFVLDADGRKMSKSAGNTVDPAEVIAENGADIMRLWVASSDYTRDLRIGPEILAQVRESYRKLRNVLRYFLGGLEGFTPAEAVATEELPPLEAWLLHRLWQADNELRQAAAAHDYHAICRTLRHLAEHDLSSLYFDIRKDSLYCDEPSAKRRRAVRTVFDLGFDFLCGWLAPTLCFTAEEAWQARGKGPESVHLRVLEPAPDAWRNEEAAARMATALVLRAEATAALERAPRRGAHRLLGGGPPRLAGGAEGGGGRVLR